MPYFHVSSSLNRASIEEHGLDWRLMGAAPGIAGSTQPEQEGCFLADHERTAEFFVRMGTDRGPVDVWLVSDVDPGMLVESPEGFHYLPGTIARDRIALHRSDVTGWGDGSRTPPDRS